MAAGRDHRFAGVCLAAASVIANRCWRPLLAERAAGPTATTNHKHIVTDGIAYIAWGLPIVTVAGALGALACVVFAVSLLMG